MYTVLTYSELIILPEYKNILLLVGLCPAKTSTGHIGILVISVIAEIEETFLL